MSGIRVVCVGASAGGLEALRELFGAAEPNGQLAWVVVQHLSPSHESLMVDLLQSHTELRVRRVRSDCALEPDVVYVIEPGFVPTSFGETLAVGEMRAGEVRHAIDATFEAAARAYGEDTVAIVLSGGGSDGTLGAREVKDCGGFVLAQSLESAAFDGMPRSLLHAFAPDAIARPAEMQRQVLRVLETRVDPSSAAMENVVAAVSELLGIDLRHYKSAQIQRRLARRLSLTGEPTFASYAERLRRDSEELASLEFDLLIGVTRFFRNPASFEALGEVLRARFSARRDPVRVWSCGCSTGEEAYSIAMLLADLGLDFQVFATDLSERAITRAARGVYSGELTIDIPPALRDRFVEAKGDGLIRITRSLRDRIVFSKHDITGDQPFNRMDLVVCRNMLIYLNPRAQAEAFDVFRFALADEGILFLGESESVLHGSGAWEPISTEHRLFSPSGRRPLAPVRRNPTKSTRFGHETSPRGTAAAPSEDPAQYLDRLAGGYLPPYLVFGGDFHLLFQGGDLADLVSMPRGKASLDVRVLLPRRLAELVEAAVGRLADGSAQDVALPVVEVGRGEKAWSLQPRLRSLDDHGGRFGLVLEGLTPIAPGRAQSVTESSLLDEHAARLAREVAELRDELAVKEAELRSVGDDAKASEAELRASNEELQSINEELQSVNEELHIMNAEYQAKISELNDLGSEQETLLGSLTDSIVFLSPKLEIRRFNDAAAELLGLTLGDVGRPIEQLRLARAPTDLAERCNRVWENGESYRVEVESDGRYTEVKISRIERTAIQHIAGLLLTISDQTSRRTAEKDRTVLQRALDSVRLPVFSVDVESGAVVAANKAMLELSQRDERFLGGTPFESMLTLRSRAVFREGLERLAQGQPWNAAVELEVGEGNRPIDLRAFPGSKEAVVVAEFHDFGRVPAKTGYIRWDARTDTTKCTPTAFEVYGLPYDGPPPTAATIRPGMSDADLVVMDEGIARAIETGDTVTVEFDFTPEGGTRRRLATRFTATKNAAGELRTVVSAIWRVDA